MAAGPFCRRTKSSVTEKTLTCFAAIHSRRSAIAAVLLRPWPPKFLKYIPRNRHEGPHPKDIQPRQTGKEIRGRGWA